MVDVVGYDVLCFVGFDGVDDILWVEIVGMVVGKG